MRRVYVEVARLGAFGDRADDQAAEVAREASGAFVSDDQQAVLGLVDAVEQFSGVSDDRGVDSAAEAFVGGDWDEEGASDLDFASSLHHVLVVFEHRRHHVHAEVLAVLETVDLGFHLRGGDHLHGLGDLPGARHGLDSALDVLLGFGEACRQASLEHSSHCPGPFEVSD